MAESRSLWFNFLLAMLTLALCALGYLVMSKMDRMTYLFMATGTEIRQELTQNRKDTQCLGERVKALEVRQEKVQR